MRAVPGLPRSVAVCARQPNGISLSVYDDGVPRPRSYEGTDCHFAFDHAGSIWIAGERPSPLFDAALFRLSVGDAGLTLADTTVFRWIARDRIRILPALFDDGLLITTDGRIVNPVAKIQVGQLFPNGFANAWRLVATVGSPYIYIAIGDQYRYSIHEFDRNTFVETGAYTPVNADQPFIAQEKGKLVASGDLGFLQLGGDRAGTQHQVMFIPAEAISKLAPLSPEPGVDKPGVTSLNIPTNDLIYDEIRDRIYATVPSFGRNYGNSVVIIDPHTHGVEKSLWVGSEPLQVRKTRDSRHLYVSFYGTTVLRRIDLESFTVDATIPVRDNDGYAAIVFDMVTTANPVEPVAACIGPFDYVNGNGLVMSFGLNSSSVLANVVNADHIEVSDSGGEIYLLGIISTRSFTRLSIANPKQRATDQGGGRSNIDDLSCSGGLCATTTGPIIDPAIPHRIGLCPNAAGLGLADGVIVDPAQRVAWFVAKSPIVADPATVVTACSLDSYRSVASLKLGYAEEPNYSFVRAGSADFALATSNRVVFFSSAALVPVAEDPVPQSVSSGNQRPGATLLPLATNHLIYDRVRNQLYATVPLDAGTFGNSIAVIDPSTGRITSILRVGSEPQEMAISDDCSFLYVGLAGSYSIARVDLESMKVDLQIWTDWVSGTAFVQARPAAVLPGDPRSVLVQNGVEWRVYKDDVPVASGFLYRLVHPFFAADRTRFFGLDSEGALHTFAIRQGVILEDDLSPVADFGHWLTIQNGLVIADSGRVFNSNTGLVAPGFLTNTSWPPYGKRVAADSMSEWIWFGNSQIDYGAISAYQTSTRELVGVLDYGGPAPFEIFPLPSGVIAVRTSGVYLIQSDTMRGVYLP